MGSQSLEDLKAQNAKEEEQRQAAALLADGTETEAVEDEETEVVEAAEPATDDDPPPIAAEQVNDEQASSGEKKFTDSDIGAVKAKVRRKAAKEHNAELDELKAQIEALKPRQPAPVAGNQTMPTLENCGYDEAKYAASMQQWVKGSIGEEVAKSQATALQRATAEQATQTRAKSVDDHYNRMAKLSVDKGVDPDLCAAADSKMRLAIDAVAPGQGDTFADEFLARLGDGSEAVVMALGGKPEAMERLQSKLLADPSGLTASMYLGELKANAVPTKRRSNAPTPAATAKGDATTSVPKNISDIQKAYKAAVKSDNPQALFEARQQARAAGVAL